MLIRPYIRNWFSMYNFFSEKVIQILSRVQANLQQMIQSLNLYLKIFENRNYNSTKQRYNLQHWLPQSSWKVTKNAWFKLNVNIHKYTHKHVKKEMEIKKSKNL